MTRILGQFGAAEACFDEPYRRLETTKTPLVACSP